MKVNFTNCLKKSYLTRKFLNRSSEGHVTSEAFTKFKEKMARVRFFEAAPEKQPSRFRQL